MLHLIFPFLEKINLLYFTGSVKPAQEHFITFLMRQKLMAAINDVPLVATAAPTKFLIFLQEGEKQELSLLYLHYLLKLRQCYVINIGQNMSLSDVKVPYDLHQPAYIFTLFTDVNKLPLQQRVNQLAVSFPNTTILLSGYQLLTNTIDCTPQNVRLLRNLSETIAFLDNLGA